MRNRTDILNDLVSFNKELPFLKDELSQYSWDTEEPYLLITKTQFMEVLRKCLDQKVTFRDLENWADLIECRDDLDLENAKLQEIVFEFASPEINGEITKERLQEIIKDLSE